MDLEGVTVEGQMSFIRSCVILQVEEAVAHPSRCAVFVMAISYVPGPALQTEETAPKLLISDEEYNLCSRRDYVLVLGLEEE